MGQGLTYPFQEYTKFWGLWSCLHSDLLLTPPFPPPPPPKPHPRQQKRRRAGCTLRRPASLILSPSAHNIHVLCPHKSFLRWMATDTHGFASQPACLELSIAPLKGRERHRLCGAQPLQVPHPSTAADVRCYLF